MACTRRAAKRFPLGGLPLALLVAFLVPTDGAAAPQSAVTPWQFPAPTESTPSKRESWLFQQRAYPLPDIPAGARLRALGQVEAFKRSTRAVAEPVPRQAWVNIGPAPILGGQIGSSGGTREMSGRVADIAVDPRDADHWLVGAAQGGVWETRDAGRTWAPTTDGQASLAMGAIAFAPSNPQVVYAGTGESEFSRGSYAGMGLLKSRDGGGHWELVAGAPFSNTTLTDIGVDPTNPDVVVAATAYGRGGRDGVYPPSLPARGIFRSTDGGVSWDLRLHVYAVSDLEPDPTDFRRQYAGVGDRYGDPDRTDNGVYRSLDAGVTWSHVSAPWDQLRASRGIGRVELALAPSNPSVLYVSIQDADDDVGRDNELLGLWRTENAWDPTPIFTQISVAPTDDGTGLHGYCAWNPTSTSNKPSPQCYYNHEIIVDPADPDVLYAGGIPLWKLNRRTGTWTEISKIVSDPANGIHVDQHAMAWAGRRLIVGNDGGVWSTTDGGGTWTDHNTNLSITQFYAGAVHPTGANLVLAGSQDNGTEKWTGRSAWRFVVGGDGGPAAISATNPNLHWAVSAQELALRRTLDGGSTLLVVTSGIDKTNASFIAPFASCAANSDIFIAGTDNLWRTDDFFGAAAPSWTSNGPEMSAGGFSDAITAVAFARSDSTCNTYAFGTASGQVLRTTSGGGSSWTKIDGSAIPGRYVTGLAFDPGNRNVLYVTLSGFDEGTPGHPGHVFKTANALAAVPTWSNVSPPVDIPHDSIVLDPVDSGVVYVGTDLGVWKSTDGGGSWTHLGPETGMPNVAVFGLAISSSRQPVAFTHGRGTFILTDVEGSCASPTVIPAAGGTFAGTTRAPSQLEGSCAGSTAGERVFEWTPAASGAATIGTCGTGTNYDTVLYLRRGCTDGTEVTCDDDPPAGDEACPIATGANHGSRITSTVTAGQTYFIVVDGFDGAQGTFGLTVTPPPAPPTTTTSSSTSSSTSTTTSSSSTSTRPPTTTTTTTSSTTVTSTVQTTTTTTTSTAPPSITVRVATVAAEPGAPDIPVGVALRTDRPVRAVSFTLVDVPDELELVSSVCTERTPQTSGFSCTANEVGSANRINVVIVSLQGALIGPGDGPVVVLRLQDRGPPCAGGSGIALELSRVAVAGADSQLLPASVENGRVGCGGVPTTTTSSTSTSTRPTSTSVSTTTSSSSTTSSAAPTTNTTTSTSSTTPTTGASSSTTTTTLPPCVSGAPCDDRDACTDDVCDPTAGCMYTSKPGDQPAGVACSADNARRLLGAPPAPVCTGRCGRVLDDGLRKIANLFAAASTAPSGRCTRTLQTASRQAAALQRRIGKLATRGRLDPRERALRLVGEATKLATGARGLVTSRYCARR